MTQATSHRTIPVMIPWLGEEEAQAAAAAVMSGWVAQGPRVQEFERAFADQVGAAHGVAVTSCTTALHLALVVAGVGAGDEVVVPSLSFVATTNAPRYVGATPVFADVDSRTGNITVETVSPVLSARTKAVIVVHQGGVPADVEPLRALADERGLLVIEDSACAAGSQYLGGPVGRGAWMSAWSFHPRKLLTTGEGGMLTTDDPDLAARLRRLREHGMSVSAADRHAAADRVIVEQYLEVGYNYRMTDVQAAIGLVQLGRLDAIVERRRALAERYQSLLGLLPGVRCVTDPGYGTSNYQSFWVELGAAFPVTRDVLLARLAAAGISARRGIMAAHLEPAHADLPPVSLPVTERLTRQTLILPLFHELTEDDQDRVVQVIADTALGRG